MTMQDDVKTKTLREVLDAMMRGQTVPPERAALALDELNALDDETQPRGVRQLVSDMLAQKNGPWAVSEETGRPFTEVVNAKLEGLRGTYKVTLESVEPIPAPPMPEPLTEWESEAESEMHVPGLREPTSEQCTKHERVGPGWACWYPQMGGYGARCIVVPGEPQKNDDGSPCFEAYVWHDGDFPFSGRDVDQYDAPSPRRIHHCMAEQFVEFGQWVASLQTKKEGES